ncbi:hypothetical protein K2X33_16620, partial [bacterium]|nr:hypothetical protein [bacterium]
MGTLGWILLSILAYTPAQAGTACEEAVRKLEAACRIPASESTQPLREAAGEFRRANCLKDPSLSRENQLLIEVTQNEWDTWGDLSAKEATEWGQVAAVFDWLGSRLPKATGAENLGRLAGQVEERVQEFHDPRTQAFFKHFTALLRLEKAAQDAPDPSLIERLPLALRRSVLPLESVCPYVDQRHGDYLRSPRVAFGLLYGAVAVMRVPSTSQDFDDRIETHLPYPKTLVDFLKRTLQQDRVGLYRAKFRRYLVPHLYLQAQPTAPEFKNTPEEMAEVWSRSFLNLLARDIEAPAFSEE